MVLVGAHGHGRWHLQNLRSLAERLPLRLVGVCDPQPLDAASRELAGDAHVSSRLEDAISATSPDVVIICTPIHTHSDLTLAAVAAGTHVLLEKPPTPTLAEFDRLVAGVEASGRACQVGFQSLGSAALGHIRALVDDGVVGDVLGIGGSGTWIRDSSYYARASWAGRRTVDGVPVMDGALTNPFAHAVASALALAGATGFGDVDEIEVELYHANPIEADDTSCIRIRTRSGTPIVIAVTLAAEESRQPRLVVHGTRGRITLTYKTGEVRVEADGLDEVSTHPSTDLLENLLAHVTDPSVPLLVPLRSTAAFMEVLEAVRNAPDPVQVPAEYLRTEGEGQQSRYILRGVDPVIAEAAERLQLFAEMSVPWAVPAARRPGSARSLRGSA